jgi:hydrogenase nickel incorporation protein HypA/HybF
MHEVGIAQGMIAIVSEHARGARVARVVVEVGKLSAVLPFAVRFCFDLCSEGTAVAWKLQNQQHLEKQEMQRW